MRRTTARRIAAVLAAALLVAGCSGDDAAFETSGDSADGGFAPASGEVDEQEAAEEPAADDAGDQGGAGVGDDVVTFGGAESAGRQLARTATVTLEVDDVESAARAVTAAAVRAGGFVQGADVRGGDFGEGFIRLRVPARDLDAVLEEVATVGVRVVSSGIQTEDLTDQLVDLAARIDNLERLEVELQQLLASVEESDAEARELLTVYERITTVRGDIERLRAQRAAAADRVALATVDVTLVARAIAPEEVEPEPESTLGRAWATTVDAFEALWDGLIWLVVTIIPVLLVTVGVPVLLLWLLVRAVRRRRAERRSTQPRTDPPPPPGPTSPGGGPPATVAPTAPAADEAAGGDEPGDRPDGATDGPADR